MVLGVALWIGLPFALIATTSALDRTARLTEPVEVWAPVVETVSTVTRTVDIALDWSTSASLVAPSWTGTVTALHADAGDTVTSGHPVVEIDGIKRLAVTSGGPFWRPLGAGAEGVDARWLNEMLRTFGHSSSNSNRVTAETVSGIQQLARKIGLSEAPTVFDPAWVIYLSAPHVTLGAPELAVGKVAPSAGEPLFAAQPTLATAILMSPGSVPVSTGDVRRPGGDNAQKPSTPKRIATAESVIAEPNTTLHIGSIPLRLDDERKRIAPESFDALTSLVSPGDTVIAGRLIRQATLDELTIPTPAIFSTTLQASCVVTKDDGTPRSIPVDVVSSQNGTSIVTGALKKTGQVMITPSAHLRTCE